jgi:glucose-1-phosphate thymidylyltransferase
MRPVTILDDGSTKNENRLGAVRDISFAIDHLNLDDDLLVLAGDNLLDFSLSTFLDYFYKKQTTCVMRHYEPDKEKLHKTGVVLADDSDNLLEMEEKPVEPKSHWAVPPFYIYKKADIPMIEKGIQSGISIDAPGSLIAWLYTQCTVHAMEMPGNRYDIGDMQSYQSVRKIFAEKKK